MEKLSWLNCLWALVLNSGTLIAFVLLPDGGKQMKEKGFTLIELMIVVAIVGILSVVSTAAYQNYVIRTQVTEAMTFSGAIQKHIAGTLYAQTGALSGLSSGSYGLPIANALQGKYVSAVDVLDGVIVVTLGNQVNGYVAGETLTFTPRLREGSVYWNCEFSGSPLLVPASCR
ncbi:pilin [Marinobacter sp. KM021]|uniref:pilin n=1 Tax=Marinobacter sp. KM021 TaxID=3075616 RepID=UPI003D6AAC62